MKKWILSVKAHSLCEDVSLLILRIVAGVAFMFHGWGKMQQPFSWMGPDAPVPGVFQFLAAFSEFGGGLAWAIGLLTMVSSLGLASTMIVAVGMHAFVLKDPFVNTSGGGSYELASVYLSISILFIMFGPGRFSLDRLFFGNKK